MGEEGVCLREPFPAPRPGGPEGARGAGSPCPRSRAGAGEGMEGASAQDARAKAAFAVQRGARGPGPRLDSIRQAGGGERRPRPRAPGLCDSAAPASPTRGSLRPLLLFGEEAESLLLVLLAKAGVGAGEGGQGQALRLDADALGLVDGGAHALQPGQHLLLRGRGSRWSLEAHSPHLAGQATMGGSWDCPF